MLPNVLRASSLAALVLCASTACIVQVGESAEETFAEAAEVSGPLSVEVRNVGGHTCVRAGRDGLVLVDARVRVNAGDVASARALAQRIADDPPVAVREGRVVIGELDGYDIDESDRIYGIELDLRVEVPAASDVLVNAMSGDACVEDVTGSVKVEAVSSDVRVRRVAGRVSATSVSGDVLLEDVGAATVETTSGHVEARVVAGDLVVRTTSGDVTAGSLAAGATVRSVSGDVTIHSAIEPTAHWDVETVSGDVDLALPRGESFHLELATVSGDFETDFGIAARIDEDTILTGDVGEDPDALVSTSTTSGDVRLMKSHE